MKMHNECFPCLARGTLDVARLATTDENRQLEILRAVLEELSRFDANFPPPLMARFIQRTVKTFTGVEDPYHDLKQKYNDLALDLYPDLKLKKDDSGDRFDTGVRLAIAGNIIDFGTASTLGSQKVIETISHSLKEPVNGEVEALKQAAAAAKNILWLGDNAGEIVFDKLLLEEMDSDKIIYAVRGGYAQNDATLADARATGMTRMVRVIDSGAAIPGTLLNYCSRGFRQAYDRADLIISKGQGNFETLDHGDPRIFFLFKAKCSVVAMHGNCSVGDIVVRASAKH